MPEVNVWPQISQDIQLYGLAITVCHSVRLQITFCKIGYEKKMDEILLQFSCLSQILISRPNLFTFYLFKFPIFKPLISLSEEVSLLKHC